MKILLSIPVASVIFAAALSAQDTALVEYYLRADSGYAPITSTDGLKYWSLTKDEFTQPDSLPGRNAAVIIDRVNTNGTSSPMPYARGDIHGAVTYYSINATVNTELNMTSPLSLISDFSVYSGSDYAYNSKEGIIKQLRFAVQAEDFLSVGGDMVLSTDKYFTTRFTLFKNASLRVGGQLRFEYNGAGGGYHAFDMSDMVATSVGTLFTLNAGGMASSGSAVYMTSAHSIASNFVFSDGDSGGFKGGSFEGVFATDSGVSSTATFTMNGSGMQSIKIYSAANAAGHGISGIGDKKDMAIESVSVNSGELIFDSELAINTVTLDGGSLKLTASGGVKDFIINAGLLAYGGTVRADSFTVAAVDEVRVVFSAEDLAAQELVLVEYGYLGESFDPNSVFAAYDEGGKRLGGEFSLTGGIGESGSLIYTVPEPAALAAAIGAFALAAVFARRGNRK